MCISCREALLGYIRLYCHVEVELSSELPAREDRSFVCSIFFSIDGQSMPSSARRSAFVAKTGRYWPRSVMPSLPSAGGITARMLRYVLRDCASCNAVADGAM